MGTDLWDELATLAATGDQIRREIARCIGPSEHRERLEAQLADVQVERERLMAALCAAVPAEIETPKP